MKGNKMTRKEMFIRIAEAMADEPEVVEFCNKQIEILNRPRKPRVNEKAIAFAERVYTVMEGLDKPITNKEMTALMNEDRAEDEDEIKFQKVAAAFKRLVDDGAVRRIEGKNKSDAATFECVR